MVTLRISVIWRAKCSNQGKHLKCFSISTFNLRGMIKEIKQNQLDDDMERYEIYIMCIQETKMKEGMNINLKNSILITFPTNCRPISTGIGFLINKRWKDSVYRVWQEGERICVMQLKTASNKILSIVNVYGPTAQITKTNLETRDEFFNKLGKTLKSIENRSTCTLWAGDCNCKVGQEQEGDTGNCLGKFSNGQRNINGESLVKFCETNKYYVVISHF